MTQIDPAPALDGARILVVEDDFLISLELDTILAGAGAQVIPCRTVAQAERAIEGDRISGAILDFRLGSHTSLPVARRLRRDGIPFLFFTAQVNATQIHDECPDAEVITKPFQRRTLLDAIAAMLH